MKRLLSLALVVIVVATAVWGYFYAQSRGMSPDAAERMIVRGFFERVVAQIDSDPIKARILEALAPRIGQTDEVAA